MFSSPSAVQSLHNMTSIIFLFIIFVIIQWSFEIYILFYINFYINIALAGGVLAIF